MVNPADNTGVRVFGFQTPFLEPAADLVRARQQLDPLPIPDPVIYASALLSSTNANTGESQEVAQAIQYVVPALGIAAGLLIGTTSGTGRRNGRARSKGGYSNAERVTPFTIPSSTPTELNTGTFAASDDEKWKDPLAEPKPRELKPYPPVVTPEQQAAIALWLLGRPKSDGGGHWVRNPEGKVVYVPSDWPNGKPKAVVTPEGSNEEIPLGEWLRAREQARAAREREQASRPPPEPSEPTKPAETAEPSNPANRAYDPAKQ